MNETKLTHARERETSDNEGCVKPRRIIEAIYERFHIAQEIGVSINKFLRFHKSTQALAQLVRLSAR